MTVAAEQLDAVPLSREELWAIQSTIESGGISRMMAYRLAVVLTTLNQFDSEPEPEDREERRLDHAVNWRVARQSWRRFATEWRRVHPVREQVTND